MVTPEGGRLTSFKRYLLQFFEQLTGLKVNNITNQKSVNQMCERHSSQQSQLASLVEKQQQRINLLIIQVKDLKEEMSQKDRQIQELSELKNHIKKVPYNMYKDFIVTRQTDGSAMNLVRKTSILQQGRITFGQPKPFPQVSSPFENYLLLKLQGDKPTLYLSTKTQISTIDKINHDNHSQDDRDSYTYVAPDLLLKPSFKSSAQLKIQKQVFNFQLTEGISPNRLKISEEHKQLLMFPPSSVKNKKTEQPLTLNGQCQVLSYDLKRLKQKFIEFTSMTQKNQWTYSDIIKPVTMNNNQTQNIKNNINTDDIAHFIQFKINQVSPVDFDTLLESKWKQEKEQYIQYISRLERELKQIKGSQTCIPKDNQTKSHLQNTPESEFKSQRMFNSSPYSEIRANYPVENGPEKYSILKSDPELANKSYFKNQYHINEMEKSRSKSKGSKIMYIRR